MKSIKRLLPYAYGGILGLFLTSPLWGVVAIAVYAEAPQVEGFMDDDVLFSPGGGCTERIIKEFDDAEESIDYQMYVLTSEPIAHALIRAHDRGIEVRVLLDAKAAKSIHSQSHLIKQKGLNLRLDKRHAIAHNKVRIIDDETVLGGSFNDSDAAEKRNAENLTILTNQSVVRKFIRNFNEHWGRNR